MNILNTQAFKKHFVADILKAVRHKWMVVAKSKAFAQRTPRFIAPKIEAACNSAQTGGFCKVASILLETYKYVNVNVSDSIKQY